MKTAVAYLRVSSDEQVENTSLNDQERICREYIEQNGWEAVAVFREEGESAKTANRPELKRMLKYCAANRINFAVALDVKRLARNVADHLAIGQTLRKHGTLTRFVLDRFEDSPSGRFHETILAAVAQYDNEERGERSRRGMQATIKAGGYVTKAPRGYINVRQGRLPTLAMDPDWAPVVLTAFKNLASGMSPKEAAKHLKVAHHIEFFRRPVFTGYYVSDSGELEKGSWPAIVPFGLWTQVQERLKVKHRTIRTDFWMRGIIRCECGKIMTASYSKGRTQHYAYYHCKACGARHAAKKTEASFIEWLTQQNQIHQKRFSLVKTKALEKLKYMFDSNSESQRQANQMMNNINKKLSMLVDMKLAGDVTQEEYDAKRNELIERRNHVQKEYFLGTVTEAELSGLLNDAAWVIDHFVEFLGDSSYPELLVVLRGLLGATVTLDKSGNWSNREKKSLYWLEETLTMQERDMVCLAGVEPTTFSSGG